MRWAIVDGNGEIQNIIAYDGISAYAPPNGFTLQQVNDWLGIGSGINDTQPPTPPAPPPPIAPTLTQLQAQLTAIQAQINPLI